MEGKARRKDSEKYRSHVMYILWHGRRYLKVEIYISWDYSGLLRMGENTALLNLGQSYIIY